MLSNNQNNFNAIAQALKNGNTQIILKNINQMSSKEKGWALCEAVRFGRYSCIEVILNHINLNDESWQLETAEKDNQKPLLDSYQGKALYEASDKGDETSVFMLLALAGDQISEKDLILVYNTHTYCEKVIQAFNDFSVKKLKRQRDIATILKPYLPSVLIDYIVEDHHSHFLNPLALVESSRKGDTPLVEYLLNPSRQGIDETDKRIALSRSASNGHNESLLTIFKFAGNTFLRAECVQDALETAADKGQHDCLVSILKLAGDKISSITFGRALDYTRKPECAKTLLKFPQVLEGDKIKAFVNTASRGYDQFFIALLPELGKQLPTEVLHLAFTKTPRYHPLIQEAIRNFYLERFKAQSFILAKQRIPSILISIINEYDDGPSLFNLNKNQTLSAALNGITKAFDEMQANEAQSVTIPSVRAPALLLHHSHKKPKKSASKRPHQRIQKPCVDQSKVPTKIL